MQANAESNRCWIVSEKSLNGFLQHANYKCCGCNKYRCWYVEEVSRCGIATTLNVRCRGCDKQLSDPASRKVVKKYKNTKSQQCTTDQSFAMQFLKKRANVRTAGHLIAPEVNDKLKLTGNKHCVDAVAANHSVYGGSELKVDNSMTVRPINQRLHWYPVNIQMSLASMGTAIGPVKTTEILTSLGLSGSNSWSRVHDQTNALLCIGIIRYTRKIVLQNLLTECIKRFSENMEIRIRKENGNLEESELSNKIKLEIETEETRWRTLYKRLQRGELLEVLKQTEKSVRNSSNLVGEELEDLVRVEVDKAQLEWLRTYDNRTETVGLDVLFDGAWQKRGGGNAYNSLTGHVIAYGGLSKLIIAFGVYSKLCWYCSRFTDKDGNVALHICPKNREENDSSGSFESTGAVDLLETMHKYSFGKVFWSKIITDDDSSTRKCLSDSGVSLKIIKL